MTGFAAVLDACVLYPAPLRDLLLRLAVAGLYRARWTERIHDEWVRNVLKDRPDLTAAQLQRTRELMDRSIADCLVTGYEGLAAGLVLPDPGDRHVLAAAVRAGAGVIVTKNLRHFPARALRPLAIEAQHPDEFVVHLLDLDEGAVIGAVAAQRAALRNPVVGVERLLETLERQGLGGTVRRLRGCVDRL